MPSSQPTSARTISHNKSIKATSQESLIISNSIRNLLFLPSQLIKTQTKNKKKTNLIRNTKKKPDYYIISLIKIIKTKALIIITETKTLTVKTETKTLTIKIKTKTLIIKTRTKI